MNFEGGRHCKIIRAIGVPLGLWPYRCTNLGKMNGVIAVTFIVLFVVAQISNSESLLALSYFSFVFSFYKIRYLFAGIFTPFPLHDDLLGTVKGMFNNGGYLQLAVFTTHEFSGDLFFKIMTGMVQCTVCIVKYFFFMLNMDQVKYIFEWIQCDYDSLTNERELRLIEKFADQGRNLAMYILCCLSFIFLPLGFPYLSVLFNLGGSLNQSRSVAIPINVEYFVNQDRYFYWIMFHIDATAVLGISFLFVTESTFVHFTTHACGLLQIVGDRVERMLESSVPTALCDKTYLSMNGQLVATIKLHQRVLEYIENINTSLLPHYCILLALGAVSLSIQLCMLARAMLLKKITGELLTAFAVVTIQFFYLGCGNYISQNLLDKGNELFTNTYYANWHEAPLPVQKMLLYIRQRSMDPAGLEFGGLYTGSFEFFAKIVNASMSYFTVLYSMA